MTPPHVDQDGTKYSAMLIAYPPDDVRQRTNMAACLNNSALNRSLAKEKNDKKLMKAAERFKEHLDACCSFQNQLNLAANVSIDKEILQPKVAQPLALSVSTCSRLFTWGWAGGSAVLYAARD